MPVKTLPVWFENLWVLYNLHVWKSNCIEIYSKIHIKFLNNSIPFRYSCLVKINWLLIDFSSQIQSELVDFGYQTGPWSIIEKKCVYTKSRSDFLLPFLIFYHKMVWIQFSVLYILTLYEFNSQYIPDRKHTFLYTKKNGAIFCIYIKSVRFFLFIKKIGMKFCLKNICFRLFVYTKSRSDFLITISNFLTIKW